MKILFAPSEAKKTGGDNPPIDKNSFCCPELYEKRLEVLNLYQNFINTATKDQLKKLFGVKEKDIDKYKIDIFKEKTLKAVERYDGVAYKYLDYKTLEDNEKDYIDKNLIIFSNLFGPILASDRIPFYKLKQGQSISGFKPEQFYKIHFQKVLDSILQDEIILDLRAGFYEKFYTIKKPYITMKFIKDGKVITHWAKAYRGTVVRYIAKYKPSSLKEIFDIPFPELKIKKVNTEDKLKTEIIYEVLEDK